MQDNDKIDIIFCFYNYELFGGYQLKFISNNEIKILPINKSTFVFELFDINFNFTILNEKIEKNYNITLEKNYKNNIKFFLNDNLDLYNLEILIKKNDYNYSITILENQNIYLNIENIFNSLNISKLFIFNINLDFNIYSINEILNTEKEINTIIKNAKSENKEKDYQSIKKQNLFLNRKRNLEIMTEEKQLINFDIKHSDLEGIKNLIFCIYPDEKFPYITIHKKQNDKLINNINYNKFQLNKQKILNENFEKINDILNYINTNCLEEIEVINYIEKKLIDFNGYIEFENIIYSQKMNILDKDFNDNHYNNFICYLYICLLKSIKIRLEKIIKIKNSKKYFLKFIKSILNKFSQFEKYENYITNNNKNNIIKNLKLHKNNLTLKEKCGILSTILNIILQSPFFKMNTYIEFYQIDLNNKNIYSKIKEFIFKIIDNSNSKSSFMNGLEMLFSPVKTNINNYNKKTYNQNTFSLEIKSLEELKNQIKNFFPSIIVRYFDSNSSSGAFFDILGDYIAINESIYIKRNYNMLYGENDDESSFKDIKDIIIGNNINNELYNLFIFKGFWRIIHECYGHQSIQKINNYKIDTPKFFYYLGTIIKKKDAGNILEFFISNNSDDINGVKNINCNIDNLLNYNLYIKNNFVEFWNLYLELLENLEDESIDEPIDFKNYELIYNAYVEENEKDDKMKYMNLNKYKINENNENKGKKLFKI